MNEWKYSVRWSNRWLTCPGETVLGCEIVRAGERCPEWLSQLAMNSCGYAINIDFINQKPIKRWSAERKAAARRRNLTKRVLKKAPLFAEELIAQELSNRPEYYSGKSPEPFALYKQEK